MKELYLIYSILQVPEVLSDIYFLEQEHFHRYGKEFNFIKHRYHDIGEVYITDLLLHDYKLPPMEDSFDELGLPIQKYTLDKNKIINIARYFFDEYHKTILLKKIKELDKSLNLDDIRENIKEYLNSVEDEYQKNKLEDNIIDVIEPLMAKVHRLRESGQPIGLELKTLPTMNNIIGGIMPTDLIGIYGKEKSAKSSLALEMMLDLCVDQKIPGAIFSFEMDNDLISMKSMSMRLGISINEFRNPNYSNLSDSEFLEITNKAGQTFARTKLYLIDQIIDEYEIESKIKKLVDRGVKIVLIDYLMLIMARTKKQTMREELNYLSQFFKRVCQKYKIAIILISQANEKGERAAEGKGLERDSNYYFYIEKIEANEQIKINGEQYRAGDEEEYIVRNRGIRHNIGGKYFICKFVNNILKEKSLIY